MSFFEDSFARILCINRASRQDRWEHCQAQCQKFGLSKIERFEAIEIFSSAGLLAWTSCTASHRACLEIAASSPGPVLILEDDFKIRFEDFHALFKCIFQRLPSDWDLFYLGGHYGNSPLVRISPCLLRCNHMLGLSSYAITPSHAARVLSAMEGDNQADGVISSFAPAHRHYIFQPRLMVQYEGWSDLGQRVINPAISMTDTVHENLL